MNGIFDALMSDLLSERARSWFHIGYQPGNGNNPGWLICDSEDIPDTVQWLPVLDAELVDGMVAVDVAGERHVKDAGAVIVLRDAK